MGAVFSGQNELLRSDPVGSQCKLHALFCGVFADLTIRFPGEDIEYKAHRSIMALSSAIFEEMFFGPMAIKGSELELPDDDPQAFEILLGSCYDVEIETSDTDLALEVYMLADKYLMGRLKERYAEHIGELLTSENVNKVLKFATHFDFESLKATCFQALETKIKFDVFDSSEVFLVLEPDWLQELLEADIHISQLVFQDLWRYPYQPLYEDNVMKILQSNCCSYRLDQFYGCVSANVASYLCERRVYHLCLSFIDHQQAKEVITVLADTKFIMRLSIHLRCSMIPADLLMQLPVMHSGYSTDLFISGVDDCNIDWVVSAICSLSPKDKRFGDISFPDCDLTSMGLKTIIAQLDGAHVEWNGIQVCSSELSSDSEDELTKWIISNKILPKRDYCRSPHIQLFETNEEIFGW